MDKKLDAKTIRKYWFGKNMVFRRVFSGASVGAGMSGKLLTFFIALFLVFAAGMGVALNIVPLSIFTDQINNFRAGLGASCLSGIAFIFWFLVMFYRVPAEIDNEQREIIESYKPNQLNIRVEKNLSKARQNENGSLVLHLSLDVINLEKRDIVELEAYLASIDQWTKYLPDGTVNGISTSHMGRLQWDDGSYQVKLKPGYRDYKKLSVAMLNCENKELRFVQEKTDRVFSYQENARYKIAITLKGKLENDPEYRFYERVTEFLCSPPNCILDFRPNADDDPNLPDELRKS